MISIRLRAIILGDINGDGIVEIIDGGIIEVAFGSKLGDLKWGPHADIVPDNFIDIQDIVLWAIHWRSMVKTNNQNNLLFFVTLDCFLDKQSKKQLNARAERPFESWSGFVSTTELK